jgi:hypothetical protein
MGETRLLYNPECRRFDIREKLQREEAEREVFRDAMNFVPAPRIQEGVSVWGVLGLCVVGIGAVVTWLYAFWR